MTFWNLRSFLRALVRQKECRIIEEAVDPHLEVTAWAVRGVQEKKPAFWFLKPKGKKVSLALNFFASPRRIEIALGNHPQALGELLTKKLENLKTPSIRNLWKERAFLYRLFQSRIKVAHQPWKGEAKVSLQDLPILTCWPGDGGPFITFPFVLTRHPFKEEYNLGVYRMQVHSPTSLGMHWQIEKGGGFHYFEAEKAGIPLPVSVILGGPPALFFATIAPLPEGMDERHFAAFLLGKPLRVLKDSAVQGVPVEVEILLDGEVPPFERKEEGPFGDHFGHYSSSAPFPVFYIKKIRARKNPIYPAAVVGKPPMEDFYLGNAVQEILNPLIRLIHPEIRDLWAFGETGFHNLLGVRVRERYPLESRKTALGLLGMGQMALSKVICVVPEEVDVRDWKAILTAWLERVSGRDDLLFLPLVPQDTLDFTSFAMNRGSKLVVFADSPVRTPLQTLPREVPGAAKAFFIQARVLLPGLLFGTCHSLDRKKFQELISCKAMQSFRLVVALSDDVALDNPTEVLWGWFTRFNPVADCFFPQINLGGILPRYTFPLGIDATWKKGYQPPTELPEEVLKKVEEKWHHLNI